MQHSHISSQSLKLWGCLLLQRVKMQTKLLTGNIASCAFPDPPRVDSLKDAGVGKVAVSRGGPERDGELKADA